MTHSMLQKLGFLPHTSLPGKGVHHYLRQEQDSKTRLHLRLEEDGRGTLLVNASRLYHFNDTAALMAYLFLEKVEYNKVIATLTRYYHVSVEQAQMDYQMFVEQMQTLVDPKDLCPLCDLELETKAPFSQRPSAPYRMDLH